MSTEKERLIEIYKEALEMELKGHKFYTEAFEKSQNEMAKMIFGQLRDDEVEHMKKIKVIYTELKEKDVENVKFTYLEMDTDALKNIFKELAVKYKDTLQASDYEIKAIDVGVEFESKAVSFYVKRGENAVGREKTFADEMAKEERVHHKILLDMKEYYENPAAYMMNHEHPHFD
jgi:rubrerythrin